MITVDRKGSAEVSLSFKYFPNYIDRVKALGARYCPEDKTWTIPVSKIHVLTQEFKGELYFKTPKWELTGEPIPDYSKFYTFKKDINIEDLGFKIKPFAYQEFGIKFLIDRLESDGMSFIADDVGIGKTCQAIGTIQYLYNECKINKTIIVCKKSLKYQWESEIRKFSNFNGDIFVAPDSKSKRIKMYEDFKRNQEDSILILNYHVLIRDGKLLNGACDYVIFDEVHGAKKLNGEINKGCQEVAKKSKFCLFMTGTPIMSRPGDMYGIIAIKDKKYFGSKVAFDKRYIVKYKSDNYVSVVGYRNLDELRGKMQHLILRRTSEEVSIQLPQTVEITKMCSKDNKQEKAIEMTKTKTEEMMELIEDVENKLKSGQICEKEKESLNYLLKKRNGALKGLIAVEQAIANSPTLLGLSKSNAIKFEYSNFIPAPGYLSSKMQTLLDLTEEISSAGKKAIVFTKYVTVANYIEKLLNKNGINTVAYSGEMNDEARQRSVSEFQNNMDVSVIVGTDALAEGVNLQVANNVINVDLPFNQAIYTQRNGRARRAGSTHSTVFVYNLLTAGTIDCIIFNKIKESQKAFDSLVSVDKAQSNILKRISN